MSSFPRRMVYLMMFMLFLTSVFLMLYYGKQTFYIAKEAPEAQLYDYHFALITEEVDNDYWRLIEKGAQKEAALRSVYLEYIGPRKSDQEEKLQTFDRMISAKVDGIIVQGLPGNRFKDLVRKAVERGIPVITIDADVPDSERQVYVGTDNYRAGVLAGQALINNTKGPQYVGVVTGLFNSLNLQLRLEGFKDAIAKETRISLVDVRQSNITEMGAAQATYALLKNYPHINALFGTSALDAIGMVQGVEEINLSTSPYIIGFDTLPRTMTLMQEGKVNATISQYPKEMGRMAVEKMIALQQQEIIEPFQYTNAELIKQEDLQHGKGTREGESP